MSLGTITTYSHHFVVSRVSARLRAAINEMSRSLIIWKTEYQGYGRPYKKVPDKTFAASNNLRNEFRYHINHLETFKRILTRYQIIDELIEWRTAEIPEPTKISLVMNPNKPPLPHQIGPIDYISSPNSPRSKLLVLQAGKGKALVKSSAIKIPSGWTTIGKVKVGDTITAWDGSLTQVTGVFPQPAQNIYRVTFHDGRWVDCTADHLWRVYFKNTVKHRRWRVVNTLEIIRILSLTRSEVHIQLIEPETVPDVALPMDPYTLGVIIADDKLSDEKFIPEDYLLKASAAQRLALLQGLLDTDGAADKNGSIQFSSGSPQLAKDVQYLVRSLGWIATMSCKNPTYTYKGEKLEGRLSYTINIRSTKPSSCFRFPRKRDRVNDDNQYASTLKLKIRSVELVDIDEAVCISVDHPDKLFVTNDFIVTHNTFSAMAGASILGDRIVATLRPKYIDQWLRDFKENCVIDPKRICVIQGSKKGKTANKGFKDLVNLVLMAEQGPLPYDVIVISVEVLRRYFDLHEEHGAELENVTGCSVPPPLFFEHIGAGTRIIDEVHENFWFNFKLDLYTNIKNSISLSATPQNDNPVIQELINVAYPLRDRYDTGDFDRYANVYSLLYSVRRPTDFNTKQRGMGSYSHVEFEKSIMKRKNTLDQYFKMVHDSMIFTYDVAYQPGNRCLVYFATVEMCGLFRDYVQKKYPDRKVIRFVSGDSYEDLQTADISVSTIGSAGTGKDIPMLTAVILTVAVNSSPSNIQGFGRLRKLPGGRRMDFVYFVGTDFIKHLDYHDRKKEILSTRALIMENRYYGTMI